MEEVIEDCQRKDHGKQIVEEKQEEEEEQTPNAMQTGNGSSSINVPNDLLESIKADVTAQVTAELTANMMQAVTTQVAQHLCSSISFHLKQINPVFDTDPAVLMRLVTTAPSLGDASSAPNQKSSIGLNGDSLIGANRTHSKAPNQKSSVRLNGDFLISANRTHSECYMPCKRGITSDDDAEEDDVIDRL